MGLDFGWRPGYEQKMMKLLIKEKKKGIFFFFFTAEKDGGDVNRGRKGKGGEGRQMAPGWRRVARGVKKMTAPIGGVCCVMCNVDPFHDANTSKKTLFEFSLLLSGSKR